jgi:hypothetical protein
MATTGASLPTQPVGGLLLAISGGGIAWTVLHSRPPRNLTEPDTPARTTAGVPDGV